MSFTTTCHDAQPWPGYHVGLRLAGHALDVGYTRKLGVRTDEALGTRRWARGVLDFLLIDVIYDEYLQGK